MNMPNLELIKGTPHKETFQLYENGRRLNLENSDITFLMWNENKQCEIKCLEYGKVTVYPEIAKEFHLPREMIGRKIYLSKEEGVVTVPFTYEHLGILGMFSGHFKVVNENGSEIKVPSGRINIYIFVKDEDEEDD